MIGAQMPSGTTVGMGRGGELRVTGKRHETVKGRFLRQGIKQEWSSTRQQMEWVERTFDRVERMYHEVYYHPVTGDVVFEKHHPIDDQSAHGKRGRAARP
jgi:hypothetical protein